MNQGSDEKNALSTLNQEGEWESVLTHTHHKDADKSLQMHQSTLVIVTDLSGRFGSVALWLWEQSVYQSWIDGWDHPPMDDPPWVPTGRRHWAEMVKTISHLIDNPGGVILFGLHCFNKPAVITGQLHHRAHVSRQCHRRVDAYVLDSLNYPRLPYEKYKFG